MKWVTIVEGGNVHGEGGREGTIMNCCRGRERSWGGREGTIVNCCRGRQRSWGREGTIMKWVTKMV